MQELIEEEAKMKKVVSRPDIDYEKHEKLYQLSKSEKKRNDRRKE